METRTRKTSYQLSVLTLQALNQVLTRIGARLDQLEGIAQNPDLHGRTIKNVGVATDATDAARLGQVTDAVDRITVIGVTGSIRAGVGISITEETGYTAVALKQQGLVIDVSESVSLPDPSDAPATADALRDDLVTTVIPAVEAAVNTLAVAVNVIHGRLRSAEVVQS